MARYARQFTGEHRTRHFSFQLTPAERSELETLAKSASLTLSEFVRLRCLSQRPNATTPLRLSNEVARKLAYELARVGTNLNQLAYHANATGSMPARDALDATLNEIVKATGVLTRL